MKKILFTMATLAVVNNIYSMENQDDGYIPPMPIYGNAPLATIDTNAKQQQNIFQAEHRAPIGKNIAEKIQREAPQTKHVDPFLSRNSYGKKQSAFTCFEPNKNQIIFKKPAEIQPTTKFIEGCAFFYFRDKGGNEFSIRNTQYQSSVKSFLSFFSSQEAAGRFQSKIIGIGIIDMDNRFVELHHDTMLSCGGFYYVIEDFA